MRERERGRGFQYTNSPNRYVDSLETSERSLTIKIKICHLIETLMQHSRDLSFWAEVQFRNQVAGYLTRWMRGEVYISENSSHEENLQKSVSSKLRFSIPHVTISVVS